MRNRLGLTLALVLVGAVMTAGAVSAQSAGVLDIGSATIEIDISTGSELPNLEGELPACTNLIDDDDDGHVDLDDPDCTGSLDDDEAKQAPDQSEDGNPEPSVEPTPDPIIEPTGESPQPFEVVPGGGLKTDESKKGKGNKKGDKKKSTGGATDGKAKGSPDRKPDGRPTRSNPTLSIAELGAAPIGVPNFMIDQFRIPPFLLPIYQACGTQHGIPWQILASINRIETAFGTNLNVSTAGAVGWMQFLPSTWKAYGVDANRDGRKDPYNPVDAICAAANYLSASGGSGDLRRAIFAYNHAEWYVDEVLLYARQYGNLPSSLISSLTGLTEGAHFPIAARARYADDISEREALKRSKPREGVRGNVADVIRSSPTRRGLNIYARKRAPVVAVNDGVVRRLGRSAKLGNYVVLEDAFGNRFTYAELGELAKAHPVPKRRRLRPTDLDIVRTSDNEQQRKSSADLSATEQPAEAPSPAPATPAANTEDDRERVFALPERQRNIDRGESSGQVDELPSGKRGFETFKAKNSAVLKFNPKTMTTRRLREGSKVLGGTLLGRLAKRSKGAAPHVHFGIQPAGRGAKKIDPKPILDGWKLLESTAIYRAKGKNPFERRASVGQILLMPKTQLQRRVLADPKVNLYSCGRDDVRSGQTDRRVLATLAYLSQRGFRLDVTSLTCGHGYYTKSGNVSHHSSGNAVDIASVNGLPILGNQGRGSITESVIQELLLLQGSLAPAQIISLMEFGGPTFALSDHDDHIHVGFRPAFGKPGASRGAEILRAGQWDRLIDRIGGLDLPTVPTRPSEFAVPAGNNQNNSDRASGAHVGD